MTIGLAFGFTILNFQVHCSPVRLQRNKELIISEPFELLTAPVMKLVPVNPIAEHCEHTSSNVRAFIMMMGLLAFSVVLSVIDQGPQAARSQALGR